MKRTPANRRRIALRAVEVWRTVGLSLLFFLSIILISACSAGEPVGQVPSSLDPKGPAALKISQLWWVLFWLAATVFAVFLIFFLMALFRRRRKDEPGSRAGSSLVIVLGGILMPSIVLMVVYFYTFISLGTIAANGPAGLLTVEIVGHRWWWEINYTEQQFVTANEIHIPVGEPVELKLTSQDVIHSFWIPQLHGKIDLIPGKVNTMRLQADEAGIYRGECAEFCGVQHALMQFLVIAEPRAEFEAWMESQQLPAPAPSTPSAERGRDVFLSTNCIQCHTIKGTGATGDLGPDLTHLASRLTLAAGTIQNTRGDLGGWITDPQSIKPGNLMPPGGLSGEQLQDLLDYLETLD